MDHKVIKTEVVLVKDTYGVRFEFDDGYTDFAEVGDKATAEFYAAVQLGERIPMNVNPLLLSAAKAEICGEKRRNKAIETRRWGSEVESEGSGADIHT